MYLIMDILLKILTYLNLASGPIMAIIAIFALRQVNLAREQLKQSKNAVRMNSLRESLLLSSDQIKYYNEEIIPKVNVLNEVLSDRGINLSEQGEVSLNETGLIIEYTPSEKIWNELNSIEIARPLLSVANSIESFSTFFVSGVADEKIAFNSLSSTYCNTVKEILIVIPINKDRKAFSAMNRLYYIWQTRLDEEKLLDDHAEIENRLSNINRSTIVPIGVETNDRA